MQNGERHEDDDDGDLWGDDGDAGDGEGGDTDSDGGARPPPPALRAHHHQHPRRALATLNALRKAGQYHDVVLVARGTELPAHRAVLVAAAPALLPALQAADRLKVDAHPDLVRALLEYAYTGTLEAERPADLYAAAWALRMDAPAECAAAALLRRAGPAGTLAAAALPDLPPRARRRLRTLLDRHAPALARLPELQALPHARIELRRPPDAEPRELAEAALAHLRRRMGARHDRLALEAACAERHLLEPRGRSLLDAADTTPEADDLPDLHKYRREAAARDAPPPAPRVAQHERRPTPRYEVLASVRLGPRATLALLHAGEGLTRASITWRGEAAPVPAARAGGARVADMSRGRCSFGLAACGGALVAVGGHDSEEVLRGVEVYRPETNRWEAGPDLPGGRARCGLAGWGEGGALAAGGSDGQRSLDTTCVLADGRWARGPPLGGRGAAEAALVRGGEDDEGGEGAWLVGGEEGGASVRRVLVLREGGGEWQEAPPLCEARAAAACAWWRGGVWACGGRAGWRCLSGVEVLSGGAGGAGWVSAPPLGVARRSAAAAVLGGRLVVVGGADGARSLRGVEVLGAESSSWCRGPELSVSRASLGVAVLGGVLYAVGGYDGGAFLSSAECLRDARDGRWTSLLDEISPPRPLDGAAPAERRREEETS